MPDLFDIIKLIVIVVAIAIYTKVKIGGSSSKGKVKSKYQNYTIILAIVIVISLGMIGFGIYSKSEERIKNRNITALVFTNGEVFVEDIWDVNIVNHSTLYQTFDDATIKDFSDIRVSYLDKFTNKWIPMTYNPHISYNGKEKLNYYHTGNFEGKFEIAWGVGLENGRDRRQYKIEYTILNGAAKRYLDTAEYYHMFVGKDFELPIENFYALISFPAPLRDTTANIWGHGAPSGEIYFNKGKVEVKAKNVPKRTFIEARVLFPKEIVYMAPEINEKRKDSVLEEERINTANTIVAPVNNISRERMLKQAIAGTIMYLGLVVLFESFQAINLVKNYSKDGIKKWERYTGLPQTKLNIFAANMIYEDKGSKDFLLTVLMKLSHNKHLEIIEIKDIIDIKSNITSLEFFDENIKEKIKILENVAKEKGIVVNPIEAAKIYSDVEREYRKEQANELKIKLKDIDKIRFKLNLKNIEEAELETDELMVIEFLKEIYHDKTMNDVKFRKNIAKSIKKINSNISVDLFIEARARFTEEVEIDKGYVYIEQYQLVNAIVNKFQKFDSKYRNTLKEVKEKGEEEGIYDSKKNFKLKTLIYKPIIEISILMLIIYAILKYLVGGLQFNEIAYIICGVVILISSVVFIIINRIQYSKLDPPLTVYGINIREEYQGLYNFLNNDSFIAEYPEQSIIIWGEFLVLATYFGIAEKVLKTLKKVHPNLATELESTNYSYADTYYIFRTIDTAEISRRNIAIATTASMVSTGSSFVSSGGGGGFSSGGGGGFGGGRRW